MIALFSSILINAFSIFAVSFLTVTANPLSSPYPFLSVSSMFVGGTVAFPFSSVRFVSVLSVLSVNVTDISLTPTPSASVTVAVILLLMSITEVSGRITLIFPSTISIYAFAIGCVSSAITILRLFTTALPSLSVISLFIGGTIAFPFSSEITVSTFLLPSVNVTLIPGTTAPSASVITAVILLW